MGLPGSQAPTRLGRYELLARLATGGMGEIFLARLEGAAGFEKLFVVKRILPHLADDARFRQMLIAEARIASKLSHANICQVYELGETDGQLYIVMEYLEGTTLLTLLRRSSKDQTPLELGLIGGVIQQVCDALHFAHELRDREGQQLGIVHRDVTPANVFLTDAGVAKVLDFGIAKVKDASANTQTGTVKGKYAYMAPEQLRGSSVDRRVDVFALGVVVFEMLALRRLFQRRTDYLTFRAVMEQPIADIRRYRHDVPTAVVEILAKALDRDPAKRFDNARQLGSVLLDAFSTVQRPWTQGEIGDYVRVNFASEIAKRSTQVASAVRRGDTGLRATMPLIAHDDGPTQVDDLEDDEFPAVDSTVSELPVLKMTAHADPREFAGQTPPPFGIEPSATGPGLQPLVRPDRPVPSTLVVGKSPRSWFWPAITLVMVAISGTALVFVWKKMNEPKEPIILTQEPADPSPPPPPGPAQLDNEVVPSLDASVDAPVPDKPSTPDKPPRRPQDDAKAVEKVYESKQKAILACQDPKHPLHKNIKVSVAVSKTGKTSTVAFSPDDKGVVLACVRHVLMTTRFPTLQAAVSFNFNLN
ncbi:MAG: serine/threonine protein kinase [Kofleriaceae bacterium]